MDTDAFFDELTKISYLVPDPTPEELAPHLKKRNLTEGQKNLGGGLVGGGGLIGAGLGAWKGRPRIGAALLGLIGGATAGAVTGMATIRPKGDFYSKDDASKEVLEKKYTQLYRQAKTDEDRNKVHNEWFGRYGRDLNA